MTQTDTPSKETIQAIMNKVVLQGHLNKALEEIMLSNGRIGGPDSIFNILGSLARTVVHLTLNVPEPDYEQEARIAMAKIFGYENGKLPPNIDVDPKCAEAMVNRPRLTNDATPGSTVYFDADGGYEGDREFAMKHLTLGQGYTIKRIEADNWSSRVYLAGMTEGFNTSLFWQPKE